METRTDTWDGAAYHRVSEPQFAWGRRVLARAPLDGDETVVDAGCGSGRLTAELLDRLPRGHVIAVDRSASMLEVAARELARFGDRVTLLQVDLLQLDLDQAADVVFSTATFHWVLDHPALFARLHRALRPGGRLVAQCGGAGNLAGVHRRAQRIVTADAAMRPHFDGWMEPRELATAETTAHRLAAAGFTDVEAALEPAPTALPDGAAYRAFLATVPLRPFLQRLPDEALGERLLDAFCAEAAGDDPPWSLDYVRLNMSARRM